MPHRSPAIQCSLIIIVYTYISRTILKVCPSSLSSFNYILVKICRSCVRPFVQPIHFLSFFIPWIFSSPLLFLSLSIFNIFLIFNLTICYPIFFKKNCLGITKIIKENLIPTHPNVELNMRPLWSQLHCSTIRPSLCQNLFSNLFSFTFHLIISLIYFIKYFFIY